MPGAAEKIARHLKSKDLFGRVVPPIPGSPELQLPRLEGSTLEEHFRTIGTRYVEPRLHRTGLQFVITNISPR